MTRRAGCQKTVVWIVVAAFLYVGECSGGSAPPPSVVLALNDILHAATPEMLRCYTPAQASKRKHAPVEKVSLRFRLDAHGKITHARIARNEIREPAAEKCFLDTLRSLAFPRLTQVLSPGEELSLNLPLYFKFTGNFLHDPPSRTLAKKGKPPSTARPKAKPKPKPKPKLKKARPKKK